MCEYLHYFITTTAASTPFPLISFIHSFHLFLSLPIPSYPPFHFLSFTAGTATSSGCGWSRTWRRPARGRGRRSGSGGVGITREMCSSSDSSRRHHHHYHHHHRHHHHHLHAAANDSAMMTVMTTMMTVMMIALVAGSSCWTRSSRRNGN
jgi:hypothetical protein